MGFKHYMKGQFRASKFLLEHDIPSDFYLSCWQKNRSSFPLLCLRTVLFLLCVGIFVTMIVVTGGSAGYQYLPIYLTHWGILLITVSSGLAAAVSWRVYLRGPIDGTFGLPWLIKVFWIVYNITYTLAFFITFYYYIFLSSFVAEIEMNKTVDFLVHGSNSILMFILLMTSRGPAHMLHFYFPVLLAFVYLVFSLIYYAAGGVDMFGNQYIYPTLDWSKPGEASITMVICTVAIIIFHWLVVGLTGLRNWLTKTLRRDSMSFSIS